MKRYLLPALAAGLVGLSGCGGGPSPVPVSGKFVYDDGQPATELVGSGVIFDDGKASATGEIQADATFTLSFGGKDDGAIPGTYKVTISQFEPGQGEKRPPRAIPPEYNDPDKTPLGATVAAGSNDLTLTVPRFKKR